MSTPVIPREPTPAASPAANPPKPPHPARQRRSLSIRLLGPVVLVAPVVLLTVAFAVLASWQNRRMIRELAGQTVEHIAVGLERQVATDLQTAVGVAENTAELLEAGVVSAENLESFRPAMQRQLRAFGDINSVVFGAPSGAATWVIRYPHETTAEYAVHPDPGDENIVEFVLNKDGSLGRELGRYPFDATARPWYVAARAAGKPTWSEVYPWVRRNGGISTLGIARVRPVEDDDGELAGVISVDVGLGAVSEFLRDGQIPDGGVAYLTGPEGALIAASRRIALISPDGGRIFAGEAEDPLIAAIASESPGHATELHEFDVEGRGFVVRSVSLKTPWDLPWTLTLAVPKSQLLAGVRDLRQKAWLVGGVLAITVLGLGIILSRSLVRPVLQLSRAMRGIGGGDLDTQVNITGWSEFRTLSHDVNRMTSDLRDRIRLRHSLDVAMEVQQQLLPADTPKISGLDIAAHSTYCDETGGDYFDFLELDPTSDGELVVVLGDVMGHGIAAALLMATARGFLRSGAAGTENLGQLLGHVNNLLVGDTGGERFMTMIVLVVDGRERTLRWSSAGQDPAIVYSAARDDFIDLEDQAGLPLGIVEGETYPDACQKGLRSGDILLVATDGVWETHGPNGEEFGKDRMRELMRAHKTDSSEEISARLTKALADFRGDLRAQDDVTFVVVKFGEDDDGPRQPDQRDRRAGAAG